MRAITWFKKNNYRVPSVLENDTVDFYAYSKLWLMHPFGISRRYYELFKRFKKNYCVPMELESDTVGFCAYSKLWLYHPFGI